MFRNSENDDVFPRGWDGRVWEKDRVEKEEEKPTYGNTFNR